LLVVGIDDALHRNLFLDVFGDNGFKAERLNTDKGSHGYHGDEPEGFRQNVTAERKANADDEGKDEGRGQRTARYAARVERNRRIYFGNEEGQSQREEVAWNEVVQHAEAKNHAHDGKGDGNAHTAGERNEHRTLFYCAARNRLDLLVEDVNGRLCHNDGKAEKEGNGNHYPLLLLSELYAHFKANGHKADFYGGKENNQAEEGVENADDDLLYLAFCVAHKNRLQNKEEHDDGRKRDKDVFQGLAKDVEKHGKVHAVFGNGVIQFSLREDTQKHYGEDRTDGAKGDEAEAALLILFIAEGRGDAHAERHDKGNGDRSRRNPARVERQGHKLDKRFRRKGQPKTHERK